MTRTCRLLDVRGIPARCVTLVGHRNKKWAAAAKMGPPPLCRTRYASCNCQATQIIAGDLGPVNRNAGRFALTRYFDGGALMIGHRHRSAAGARLASTAQQYNRRRRDPRSRRPQRIPHRSDRPFHACRSLPTRQPAQQRMITFTPAPEAVVDAPQRRSPTRTGMKTGDLTPSGCHSAPLRDEISRSGEVQHPGKPGTACPPSLAPAPPPGCGCRCPAPQQG